MEEFQPARVYGYSSSSLLSKQEVRPSSPEEHTLHPPPVTGSHRHLQIYSFLVLLSTLRFPIMTSLKPTPGPIPKGGCPVVPPTDSVWELCPWHGKRLLPPTPINLLKLLRRGEQKPHEQLHSSFFISEEPISNSPWVIKEINLILSTLL